MNFLEFRQDWAGVNFKQQTQNPEANAIISKGNAQSLKIQTLKLYFRRTCWISSSRNQPQSLGEQSGPLEMNFLVLLRTEPFGEPFGEQRQEGAAERH